MNYISTRGGMQAKTFSEILIGGLAPDGGLIIPEYYPKLSATELGKWRDLNYRNLAYAIIRRFITDIPSKQLRAIINKTYTSAVFRNEHITPVKPLSEEVYLLGLSNGPTLAFKDIAMQLLGHLFEYVLAY